MGRIRICMLTVMIVTILLAAGGCTGMYDNNKSEMARTAIEQKYGEEFIILETRSGEEGGLYAWVSPAENPNVIFRAELNEDATIISDNYPVRRLCEELTEKAEWALKGYDEEFYVFTENLMEYTTDENADVTIDKYLEDNPGDKFYISVFVEETADLDQLYEHIVKMRQEIQCKNGSIDTFVLPAGRLVTLQNEIERYDEMDAEEAQTIISESRRVFIDMNPAASAPTLEDYKEGLIK